jgi:hypothetical protein
MSELSRNTNNAQRSSLELRVFTGDYRDGDTLLCLVDQFEVGLGPYIVVMQVRKI